MNHFVETDFDLHGFVRVRLEGATRREVSIVERQLGPISVPAGTAPPDITVRFIDQVARDHPANLVGLREAAFTEEGFLVVRGKNKSEVRVQIPLDRIGTEHVEILCERGLNAVPLLIPILNLTALSRGFLPMHASAFSYRGQGALVTGWAKGGKTETLLAFASNGARYVGDEWVYLGPDGRMFGIPEPIRIRDWHLAELPSFRATVPAAAKARLGGLRLISGTMRAVASPHHGIGRLMQRALPLLEKQRYVHLEPGRLFGTARAPASEQLDTVLFVLSSEAADIRVEPMDADTLADRMVFSLSDERADFQSFYRKFRFAFPERSCQIVETGETVQRDLLRKALAGVPAYRVTHPYPVSIPALYEALAHLFETKPVTGVVNRQSAREAL